MATATPPTVYNPLTLTDTSPAPPQTQSGTSQGGAPPPIVNTGSPEASVSTFTSMSYGIGALLSDVDWANITASAIIGYDAVTKQLIIVWDGSSSGSGNAFIYSFRTQNWYKVTDLITQSVNMTNFENGRNNILYTGGGSSSSAMSMMADRNSSVAIDIISADFFMENIESLKNLTRISVNYKGGSGTSVDVDIATNGSSTFTNVGTLSSTSAGYVTETISLTSNSAFKAKKTFQLRFNGTAAAAFEIQDISLVYRNLGVRV